MTLLRFLIIFSLLHLTILVPAQNFKVIKETDDYILKECDSGFYFSHGIEPKDDFVIDTTKIHKVNGVLTLPLDNGKEVVFRDSGSSNLNDPNGRCYFKGYNKPNGYYLVEVVYGWDAVGLFLIDRKNGISETILDYPLISTNSMHYAFIIYNDSLNVSYVKIRNLKSHKTISIPLEKEILDGGERPLFIKWIDEKSISYRTQFFESRKDDNLTYKYYLVEIKK